MLHYRYSYSIDGSLVSVNYNGTEYYYLRNGQNDVVGLVDGSGNTVVEYRYDAWGKLLSTTGSLASTLGVDNPIRYRGYYYDTETGLYYLQSRYYDPDTGRFINADDIVMIGAGCSAISYNLFAYCENNAPSMHDIGGYATINVICAAIGAIAGWFFGDYVAKKLGYRSGWKYWAIRAGIVIGGAVIGWFAGTLIAKVVAGFLKANNAVVLKLIDKYGVSKIFGYLTFLGVNAFKTVNSTGMLVGFARAFSSKSIYIGLEWAKMIVRKAMAFGYSIVVDSPGYGWGWHIHILNEYGKRISGIHLQITKAVYEALKALFPEIFR